MAGTDRSRAMMRSLWISKTGMEAQQMQLDTISNNLANVSTNGYKFMVIDGVPFLAPDQAAAAHPIVDLLAACYGTAAATKAVPPPAKIGAVNHRAGVDKATSNGGQ